MNARLLKTLLTGLAAAAILYIVGYIGVWQWGFCRIDVPQGQSLLLRYKGPWPFGGNKAEKADEATLVKLDKSGQPEKVGILEVMPGPGRHFYSPLEYVTELVPDVVINPGELGVVTSNVGKSLPSGTILADAEGYRGTWRRVLTPGRYRMNRYAYRVEKVDVSSCLNSSVGVKKRPGDPTLIPPGYVGVVTNMATNAKEGRDIQDNVLQPGIYYINPQEKRVDVISIGYNETTLQVETARNSDGTVAQQERAPNDRGDRLGQTTGTDPVYVKDKGIEFPSSDGFPIHLDYTAIWGIVPDQAPDVVRQFGGLTDVEQKVVLPQIGSICQIHGSKRGAVDLLVGDSRENFQTDTSEELEKVLGSKNLTLLFGLTRHIYVPTQVREPIQKKNIADELKLTRDQEQLTAKALGDLNEAKAKVGLEEGRTKSETENMRAKVLSEGEKLAKEVSATTEKLKAAIDVKTALVQAQITTTKLEADAKKTELINQAEADKYRQYVETLGGPDAYNKYVFAEGLPPDLRLGIFYAGPGTFWTDLKGFEQTMLGKLASEGQTKPTSSTSPRIEPISGGR